MQVHVDRGGERYGPYSLEEVNAYLANGTLLPTDQAWQDGMPNWVPINQMPGVAMSGGATVPPPTPAPVAGATCPQCQTPVEADQVVCMGCGTQLHGAPATAKGSKKKLLIGIGAGMGALAIIAGIWIFFIRDGGSGEQSADAKKPVKPNAGTKAEAEKPERPKKPGTILWEFNVGMKVESTPAIGADGTVYVGEGYPGKKVYALDGQTGAKKWEFETKGSGVDSSPAIGADGTIYIGSRDKKVYALDGKTGVKKWEFGTGGGIESSPAIGLDGTVFVGSGDKKLYALDGETGAKQWEFLAGHLITSSPAIGPDSTVYFGSWDNMLYAFNGLTGRGKWGFNTNNQVRSSPAIGVNGVVYIASGKKVYAIKNAGIGYEKQWEFSTINDVNSTPVVGVDGTVYVGATDSHIYALNGQTGARKWVFKMENWGASSPAIGADGTIYILQSGSKIYALNGETGLKKWETTLHQVRGKGSSPVIGINGTIYVGACNGKVYAIASESKGPAKSPWPMRGQNARHTGRVMNKSEPPKTAVKKPSLPQVVPNSPKAKAAIEMAIRKRARKPTGKLTKLDLDKVTGLDLQFNQLTDVSALAKLTQLGSLHLANNNLTDVSPLVGLKKLEYLTLGRNNQLTDISALAELKQLKTLILRDSKLNKAEIDKLQKELPNCKIFR